MEEVKQYVVYAHYYNGELFYIGSGRIYTKEENQISRHYDYRNGRSSEWKNFCKGETDKIKVEILFETNNRQIAYDKEAEITRMYMEKGFPLVNVNIGNHISEEHKRTISLANKGKESNRKGVILSEETKRKQSKAKTGKDNPMYGRKHTKESRNKMSESRKGENHPMYGKTPANAKKVLIINNKNGESKVFDSIPKACEFISQNGFDKTKDTLKYHLKKGPFTFNTYTLELIT